MASHLMRQSLPLLVVAGLAQLGSGGLLTALTDPLEKYPELLVMVPALLGLKGSIEVSLGSRLGSALHLGLWGSDRFFNQELKNNLIAATLLTLGGALIIGIFGFILASFHGSTGLALSTYMAVALMAGVGAGLTLVGVTVGVVWLSHQKGLDPDNVTAPILTTSGDLLGLAWYLAAISIFVGGVL